jgi:serine phosphatase RsbU (regulator of sigma subunit)
MCGIGESVVSPLLRSVLGRARHREIGMLDTAERERLAALQALGVLDTGPEERFDRVTRIAQRVFQVPMVAVTFIDADRQWFKARIGLDAVETPREQAFCDHTIRHPGAMVVPDATADERFVDNPLVTGDPHIRFYAGHPLHAPGGQRVGSLCIIDDVPRQLSEPDAALLADLAAWVESELALRDDLERAQRVQRSLLPSRPPSLAGFDIAGGCQPATEVAGDFFDWFPVGDELQLTVADVMGKGVGSAIIAASVRAVLRSTSRAPARRGADERRRPLVVADAVAAAARGLEPDLEETSSFVTMFTGRLDPVSGTLRYVDAGHGLTLIVPSDGDPVPLPSSGDLPIGIAPDGTWTEHVVELQPGDTMISVSDGILDFFRTALEVLDAARIVTRGTETAQDTVDEIIRFARARRLKDDVTALVVRRDPV